MFEAKISAEKLRHILTPVGVLSERFIIKVNQDGIEIPVANEAKSAQANILVSSEAFDEFNVSEDQIGLSVERLKKIVDKSDAENTIKLEVDREINALHIRVGGQHYRLGILDEENISVGPQELGLNHRAEVVIEKTEFSHAIEAAEMFSDEVDDILFMVHEGNRSLILKAEGDTDLTERELTEEDLESFVVGPAYSRFSLEYMSNVKKSIPDEVNIKMHLDKDRPAKIEYDIADNNGQVAFYIAPRIKNN